MGEPTKDMMSVHEANRVRELDASWAYMLWRWEAWLNGHGSYRDIEDKIERGELIPGQPTEDRKSVKKNDFVHEQEAR